MVPAFRTTGGMGEKAKDLFKRVADEKAQKKLHLMMLCGLEVGVCDEDLLLSKKGNPILSSFQFW